MGIMTDKYLVVDARNIYKKLYNCMKVPFGPDYEKVYEVCGNESATESFKNNRIPEKFQKIFIRLNKSILSCSKVEEPLTGFSFDYKKRIVGPVSEIKTIYPVFDDTGLRGKGIVLSSYPYFDGDEVFLEKYSLMSNLDYCMYEELVDFLKKLNEEGCFSSYCKTLTDFFELSYDMHDLLVAMYTSNDLSKSLSNVLKVYASRASLSMSPIQTYIQDSIEIREKSKK